MGDYIRRRQPARPDLFPWEGIGPGNRFRGATVEIPIELGGDKRAVHKAMEKSCCARRRHAREAGAHAERHPPQGTGSGRARRPDPRGAGKRDGADPESARDEDNLADVCPF